MALLMKRENWPQCPNNSAPTWSCARKTCLSSRAARRSRRPGRKMGRSGFQRDREGGANIGARAWRCLHAIDAQAPFSRRRRHETADRDGVMKRRRGAVDPTRVYVAISDATSDRVTRDPAQVSSLKKKIESRERKAHDPDRFCSRKPSTVLSSLRAIRTRSMT